MRAFAALLIVAIAGPVACTSFGDIGRAEPASPLPDLSVSPEDIGFSFYGDPLEYGLRGLPIDIGVTVRNAGPGNSSSANVTLSIDGAFVAVLHVMSNLTAESPGNSSAVRFIWDTAGIASGNHTIRAVADDTAGDAAPADNGAETVFYIFSNAPAITLSLSPTFQTAIVTPTDSAVMQFNGTVKVDIGEWEEATMTLSASVDQGWVVSLAPGAMVFTDAYEKHFNVTAVVPAAWPAANSASLKVHCTLRAETMQSVADASVIVNIRPYHRLSVESDDRDKDLAVGGEAIFGFKVWNRGNADDSFNVTVENLDELRRDGWDISLERDKVLRLPRGDYQLQKIIIGAPHGWSIYEDNTAVIKLNVSSINAADFNTNVSTTYTLTVRERGFNMPCLMSALAGAAVIIIAAVAAVMFRRRGKTGVKTVKDYMKELDLDEGD